MDIDVGDAYMCFWHELKTIINWFLEVNDFELAAIAHVCGNETRKPNWACPLSPQKLCVLWIYLWLCVCARMIDDREREREQHSIDAGHRIAIARIWTPTFTVSPSRFMRWLFQRLNCAIGLGCYLFVMLLFVFLILFPFTLTFYLLWLFFGLAFFLNVQSTLHLTLVFAFAPFAIHMILLKSITTTQKN